MLSQHARCVIACVSSHVSGKDGWAGEMYVQGLNEHTCVLADMSHEVGTQSGSGAEQASGCSDWFACQSVSQHLCASACGVCGLMC
jgi:hypothetical protein